MSNIETLAERFPGLKSSAAIVLDYLLPADKGKAISNMVALNVLGQGSLTSRMSEIGKWLAKDAKLKVKAEWKTDTHRKKRYKSYQIVTLAEASPASVPTGQV